MDLSIIIPLYNEENLVITVIEKLTSLTFPNFINSFEIIIVDDCSSDNSYPRVCEFTKNFPNIKCLHHEINKGKGAAVKTGILAASGDIYLIQDADLELSPSDIPRMLLALKNLDVELVNGSRYLQGIDRPLSSYKRYIANRFFTFLTSLIINVNLTDMACGYKLIHKNLWNKLHIQENRFGFEAELLIKALKIKKNNIAEVPVQYFPRNEGEGKKLKNIDGFKILWVVLKYGFLKKK
jgi:glycosyltransferase involved in cell wall biosynthesis